MSKRGSCADADAFHLLHATYRSAAHALTQNMLNSCDTAVGAVPGTYSTSDLHITQNSQIGILVVDCAMAMNIYLLASCLFLSVSTCLPKALVVPVSQPLQPFVPNTTVFPFLDRYLHRNLTDWPPFPYVVPVPNHPQAELRFGYAGHAGTADQTREAIDLMQYEIAWYLAHPLRWGPDRVVARKKTTPITMQCEQIEQRSRFDPLWTFPLFLDMLRTFEGLLSTYGMREVNWAVWNQDIKKVMCSIWLESPWDRV